MSDLNFDSVVSANVHGYQLMEISDIRDQLIEHTESSETAGDAEQFAAGCNALERLELLVKCVPGAKYALWRPREKFMTVARTVESLKAEFSFLRYEKVTK